MYISIPQQYLCVLNIVFLYFYFVKVRMPSDELETLLAAADHLQLSLLQDQPPTNSLLQDQQPATNANVPIKGQQGWRDTGKGGRAKQEWKTGVKTIADKENQTNPVEPKLPALPVVKKIGLGKPTLDKFVKDDRISRVQMESSGGPGNDSVQQVNKKASCSECGKEFEAFNHLWVHIQAVHHMRHQCKNCGKRYSSAGILNQHVESAHNGIHLVCQDCGKKFGWQATLNKHIRKKHLNVD